MVSIDTRAKWRLKVSKKTAVLLAAITGTNLWKPSNPTTLQTIFRATNTAGRRAVMASPRIWEIERTNETANGFGSQGYSRGEERSVSGITPLNNVLQPTPLGALVFREAGNGTRW
jgi:hypothetical protein